VREVRLRYTEPLLREAVRHFVLRALARQFGVTFFLVLGGLVVGLAWLLHRGEPAWTVGFLVAVLLFGVLSVASVYVAHRRNTIGRFRRMRSPDATLAYDEENLSFASDLGSSTVPWSAVSEVWKHDRFWLLLFSPSQFVTLPLDDLDQAARDFIARKLDRRGASFEAGRWSGEAHAFFAGFLASSCGLGGGSMPSSSPVRYRGR